MKRAKRTIAILSLALAGCSGTVVPSSPTPTTTSLHLLVEHSASPLLRDLAAAYHPDQTLIAWDIQAGDLQTLTNWLDQKDAPFALTNFLPPENSAWSTPIGQDGLAIVVNAANPIDNLTPAQLRNIYSGRVLNWRELGGADLAISVISRQAGSSDGAWFQSLIMGNQPISGAARLATTSQTVLLAAAADPGAIGYVSMRYLKDAANVRAVPLDHVLPTVQTVAEDRYELRSPLLFFGPTPPGDDAYRAFMQWVQSPAGQMIVGASYAPLKVPGGG